MVLLHFYTNIQIIISEYYTNVVKIGFIKVLIFWNPDVLNGETVDKYNIHIFHYPETFLLASLTKTWPY